MERDGDVSPDWRTIYAEEPDEDARGHRGRARTGSEPIAQGAPAKPGAGQVGHPEEAIDELKRKIERLARST